MYVDDFSSAIEKFQKKKKTNCMKSLFESVVRSIQFNIRILFHAILAATAPQMVHPLSPILAYPFHYFGRYLTNKCFNVSIEAGLSV